MQRRLVCNTCQKRKSKGTAPTNGSKLVRSESLDESEYYFSYNAIDAQILSKQQRKRSKSLTEGVYDYDYLEEEEEGSEEDMFALDRRYFYIVYIYLCMKSSCTYIIPLSFMYFYKFMYIIIFLFLSLISGVNTWLPSAFSTLIAAANALEKSITSTA